MQISVWMNFQCSDSVFAIAGFQDSLDNILG